MTDARPTSGSDSDSDDPDVNPPGPADHGGHGGMATRENSVDDEDTGDKS